MPDYEELFSMSKDDFIREKILAATKKLLLKTTLHKLTVTSICEQAGIARSSFYNQFTDLNDALDWEFGGLFNQASTQNPFHKDWRQDMINQLITIMELMKKEENVYKRIGKDMSLTDYNSIFQRTCRRRTRMLLDAIKLWQGEPADARCVSAIDFYVHGESITVANWMVSMKETPKSVARTVVDCIPVHLGNVMDKSFAAYCQTQET